MASKRKNKTSLRRTPGKLASYRETPPASPGQGQNWVRIFKSRPEPAGKGQMASKRKNTSRIGGHRQLARIGFVFSAAAGGPEAPANGFEAQKRHSARWRPRKIGFVPPKTTRPHLAEPELGLYFRIAAWADQQGAKWLRTAKRHSPVAFPQEPCYPSVVFTQEIHLTDPKIDLLQGTLDVMVLQTLAVLGTQHGYGIARRIEQVSGEEVLLNQGTIYASLVRLQQRGWIAAEWGVSDNNRRAKFYSITPSGNRQLADDVAYWQRLSKVMSRVLSIATEVQHDS
jgi:transcriptional regulator